MYNLSNYAGGLRRFRVSPRRSHDVSESPIATRHGVPTVRREGLRSQIRSHGVALRRSRVWDRRSSTSRLHRRSSTWNRLDSSGAAGLRRVGVQLSWTPLLGCCLLGYAKSVWKSVAPRHVDTRNSDPHHRHVRLSFMTSNSSPPEPQVFFEDVTCGAPQSLTTRLRCRATQCRRRGAVFGAVVQCRDLHRSQLPYGVGLRHIAAPQEPSPRPRLDPTSSRRPAPPTSVPRLRRRPAASKEPSPGPHRWHGVLVGARSNLAMPHQLGCAAPLARCSSGVALRLYPNSELGSCGAAGRCRGAEFGITTLARCSTSYVHLAAPRLSPSGIRLRKKYLFTFLQESYAFLDNEQSISYNVKAWTYMVSLRFFHDCFVGGNKPSWIFISSLSVSPPATRPLLEYGKNSWAISETTIFYRHILYRSSRLRELLRLYDYGLNEGMLRIQLLQESLDQFLDNARAKDPMRPKQSLTSSQPLKSVVDSFGGKFGRFRQNLLGKRVNFSGRSVIVVGPGLQLHQCGLPYEMALTLCAPFLVQRLSMFTGISEKSANLLDKYYADPHQGLKHIRDFFSWFPVIINRAPSLHRLSMEAFQAVIIPGRAIQMHPLVCPPFNADFDGDQVAVHVPISMASRSEAMLLLLASAQWLSPARREATFLPTQDMILGFYYMTFENPSFNEYEKVSNSHLCDSTYLRRKPMTWRSSPSLLARLQRRPAARPSPSAQPSFTLTRSHVTSNTVPTVRPGLGRKRLAIRPWPHVTA